MNEQDSRDMLDYFMSLEELSIEQVKLDREFKEGARNDGDFWEECRIRSIQLTK